MNREEALTLLDEQIQSANMKKHCYASEAVMRALARRLGKNEETWGLAGLLHDIDVEITNADPYTHGPYASRLLEGKVPPDVLDAIVMHNALSKIFGRYPRKFDHAKEKKKVETKAVPAVKATRAKKTVRGK